MVRGSNTPFGSNRMDGFTNVLCRQTARDSWHRGRGERDTLSRPSVIASPETRPFVALYVGRAKLGSRRVSARPEFAPSTGTVVNKLNLPVPQSVGRLISPSQRTYNGITSVVTRKAAVREMDFKTNDRPAPPQIVFCFS